MKKIVYFLTLIFIGLFYVGCEDEPTEVPVVNPNGNGSNTDTTTGWRLVFEDDFNSNLSAWSIWNSGAFNEEIQLYTAEQLSLNDGILSIHSYRKNVQGATDPYNSASKDFEYVSARIESKELFGPSSTAGASEYRFMARIKLPAGHGMWPAFWTYGDPWPTQGEIDILEARGGEKTVFQSNIFYGENPNENMNYDTEAIHQTNYDLTDDFHIYEMIWKSDSIHILFDNELIHTYEANRGNNIFSLFGKKQKVVLNTAVGGHFFSDRFSSNYADSATMEIDWVRVYSQ